jgi:hypothetical protein
MHGVKSGLSEWIVGFVGFGLSDFVGLSDLRWVNGVLLAVGVVTARKGIIPERMSYRIRRQNGCIRRRSVASNLAVVNPLEEAYA